MTDIFNTTCYDYYGNVITHLTQWDQGQTLTFKDLGLSAAPEFHFCNRNSEEAIDVLSTIDSDGNITVDVPNILLEESETIIAYIYAYYTSASAKTVQIVQIPVKPKPQPTDYQYVNNIEYVSASSIIDEAMELVNSLTKESLGLGNVDNTADADKSVSHASTADSATSADNAAYAETAIRLDTARKIDGIDFDGTTDIIHFAKCDTPANTLRKEITLDGFTGTSRGLHLSVLFTYGINDTGEGGIRLIINGTDTATVRYQDNSGFCGPVKAGAIVEFEYLYYWHVVGDVTRWQVDELADRVDNIEERVEEIEEEVEAEASKTAPYETLWTGMSTSISLTMDSSDAKRTFMVEGGYSSDGVNISGTSINDTSRRGRVVFFLAPDYLPDMSMESGTYWAHDTFVHPAEYTGSIDMSYSGSTMRITTSVDGGPSFYVSRVTILR